MAAKNKSGGEERRDETGMDAETRRKSQPENLQPDNVDAMVSNFLAKLAEISSATEEAFPPETQAGIAEDDALLSEIMRDHVSNVSEAEKGPGFESSFALERINNELEKSLNELEQLKAERTPVPGGEDSKPESFPKYQAEAAAPGALAASQRDAEHATRAVSKRDVRFEATSTPVHDQKKIWGAQETFSRLCSFLGAFQWRKKLTIGLAAGIIVGILAISAFFLIRSRSQPTAVANAESIQTLPIPDTVSSTSQVPEQTSRSASKRSKGPPVIGTASSREPEASAQSPKTGSVDAPANERRASRSAARQESETAEAREDIRPVMTNSGGTSTQDRGEAESMPSRNTNAREMSADQPDMPPGDRASALDSLPKPRTELPAELATESSAKEPAVPKPQLSEATPPRTATQSASTVTEPAAISSPGLSSTLEETVSRPVADPILPKTQVAGSSRSPEVRASSPTSLSEPAPPEAPAILPKNERKVDTEAPAPAKSETLTARTPVPAEIAKMVQPTYPAIARRQRIFGKVDVELEISDNGDVVRATAVSGPLLLRAAAEEALMKWKFKPASINGVNMPSMTRISVNFIPP